MKHRLIAATLCTIPSFLALLISQKMGSPLFISAWGMYFLILVFWVKNNCAPKALLIIGTIFGVVSVVVSKFTGLLLAFPSVMLMVHVIKCSFFPQAPNKSRHAEL